MAKHQNIANETGNIFEVRNLSFSYAQERIFDDISFDIKQGKITALMGANGAGKSTLFKLLAKNLKSESGSPIKLDGRDLSSYRLSELAKKLAVVWQNNRAPHDITVHDLVAYGRVPHKKAFQSMTHEDEAAIAEALQFCDLEDFAQRRMQELSGGQQQRAWIAMGLAQQTPVMFFDEPTSFLDVHYQVMVLRLIRKLNRELGLTVVVILHDINQSFELCDELIALRPDGSLIQGSTLALADEDFLREIYNTDLKVGKIDDQMVVHAPI
ncbi:MAG: ABC transporter ATP-binding protein [Coriobacteriia bacterium]|nr:ABC transporter ATP-binding protein [Coriobacteriia bacterium]